MLRKTLTILSLIGLLLSVGLWGVSYLNLFYLGAHHEINTWGGYVLYGYRPIRTSWPDHDLGWSLGAFDARTIDANKTLRQHQDTFLWQTLLWPRYKISKQISYVAVPMWMPTLLFASACFAFLLPFYYCRKRKKLGLCVACAYNLRGLTELRCPECNTPFESHD